MSKIHLHQTVYADQSLNYLHQVLHRSDISEEELYSDACERWFAMQYNAQAGFLCNSCTDALEMTALLSNLTEYDEVIVPSYTFVSTAGAFALRNCKLRFADCVDERPNISLDTILPLVNEHTKAIVVMHYAGIAVDMDAILDFANDQNIIVVEDAAHAMGAKYRSKYLGTLGDFGAISFHHTKIISCGEGGICFVNNKEFWDRAAIVYEKGTNRDAFNKKYVDKYEWIEKGSSFAMSEFQAAILYAQLEGFNQQLTQRKRVWNLYMDLLKEFEQKELLKLPDVPTYAEINGSHFYIVTRTHEERSKLQVHLASQDIASAFHYLALHNSPYNAKNHHQHLPNADHFEKCLLRLPLHTGIGEQEVLRVVSGLYSFYRNG